jgi:hypothetical protein
MSPVKQAHLLIFKEGTLIIIKKVKENITQDNIANAMDRASFHKYWPVLRLPKVLIPI